MKRIQAACICQTLHFQRKEDVAPELAAKLVQEEVAQYKRLLERNHTKHRILEEIEQPDHSVILKIIKQYNNSPIGNYLNM